MRSSLQPYLVLLGICFTFIPVPAFSAQIIMQASSSTIAVGQQFLVDVVLDTEKISSNAIEGELLVPPEFLVVDEVRDGNSIVNAKLLFPIWLSGWNDRLRRMELVFSFLVSLQAGTTEIQGFYLPLL